ncbi:hypothetical protein PIB30_011172 [Stylosanthes scabra]|uniref:Protein FAR1-RELATED SEQUENCE n=1 Tax=Stylosanthes scabra TaxID=79078 RepID=A0ABU6R621_9FABA|nr:hypothetical protein [Stylosanthes scabra]
MKVQDAICFLHWRQPPRNVNASWLRFTEECGEQDNCLKDKEHKELKHDAKDLRGLVPCVSSSPIEQQFRSEYTNSVFRDVHEQFLKKADCMISSMREHGSISTFEVEQQKMVSELLVYTTFKVTYSSLTSDVPSRYILPRWSKNVHRKHTQINTSHDVKRSDESMSVVRALCSHFYNVAQDFVANLEEAVILHDALEGARLKLSAHRESNQTTLVLEDANDEHSQDGCPVGAHELVGPKRVPTRGRPSTTRLGAKRNKTFKKAALKRKNGRNGVAVYFGFSLNVCIPFHPVVTF